VWSRKGHKRAQNVPFLCPRWFRRNRRKSFRKNGGDDETRTRDLCRDSATALGISGTYRRMKTAQVPENHAEF
jgi:hypothetical protein